MLTNKDWFIEYVAHTESQPTEEEWLEYIDRLSSKADYYQQEDEQHG